MSRLGIGGVTMNHSPGGLALWKWSKYQVGPDHMRFMEEEMRKSRNAYESAATSLIDTLKELRSEKVQNEHLKKLLFQVLDFSKNRAIVAEERTLRDEIEEALKNSS